MADMGDTLTTKIVVGATAVRNNKGWTISGVAIAALVAFGFTHGGKALDLFVTNAPAYRLLEQRTATAEEKLEHIDHLIANQNRLLRLAHGRDEIPIEELLNRTHEGGH